MRETTELYLIGALLVNLALGSIFGIQSQSIPGLFLDNLLSNYFDQCNIVHFRNEFTERGGPLTRNGNLPIIEIKSKNEGIETTFFNKFDKNHISRLGKQCRIYFIYGATPGLSHVFTNPALQVQAQQSYLILSEESESAAQALLYSPYLKNYKHRIWMRPSTSKETQFQVQFHHYCYNCGTNAKQDLIPVSNPLVKSFSELFPDTTGNLNGRTLTCTAPQAPPLVAIINSKENHKLIVGMQEIILKETARKMNFTFALKRAKGGATGIPLSNGTWTGIMGEVLSSQADIGLSVSTSYERNKILDFTVPTFHAFLVLVSVKPLPHFDWEAIFYPFDRKAWTAILTSTLLMIICFRVLHNKSIRSKKKHRMTFFKSAYMAIGALVEQGVPLKLHGTPSRVNAGFWFLLAMVVTCAYRSKLFMFLTFPTTEKPPSTLQELSVSDYSWGMKSLGGVGLLLITKSPLAYSRQVGERLELSFDKYSCLDKTFTHHYVCIIYRAYIDYMAVVRYWKINHKFFISDYVTSSVGASWVLPKYSPLLKVIDKYHISQFEMGLANKYVEKYQQGVAIEARATAQLSNSSEDVFGINANYEREVDGPMPLRLDNMAGAFFILCFGSLFALGIFLIEFLQKKNLLFKLIKRYTRIKRRVTWK